MRLRIKEDVGGLTSYLHSSVCIIKVMPAVVSQSQSIGLT